MAETVREKLRLSIESLDTPIGVLRIVTDGSGALRAVGWLDLENRLQRDLRRQYGAHGFSLEAGRAASDLARSIRRYFAGELSAIDALPVQTAGTAFQRAVWRALRGIPCGTTVTYAELAERIGRPAAMRAVGAANGANPIGVVVPCHRVVGADGSLTGYGGGLERKAWLLRHEERA
jgi:methylated-DNA-[protein]-cysteine S-methyltransferase